VPEGDFRTDDLALATVLSIEGYRLAMEKTLETTVVWVVNDEDADDDLASLVEEYLGNRYRVEPRAFVKELHVVRSRMYELLNFKGNKRLISPKPVKTIPEVA